jgi:hypothetical protein
MRAEPISYLPVRTAHCRCSSARNFREFVERIFAYVTKEYDMTSLRKLIPLVLAYLCLTECLSQHDWTSRSRIPSGGLSLRANGF